MDATEILLPMLTIMLRFKEWSLKLVSHSKPLSGLLVEPPDVPAPEMELQPVTVPTNAPVRQITTPLCSASMQVFIHVKTIS